MPKIIVLFISTYLFCLTAAFLTCPSWGVYLYQVHYFLNPENRWWHSHLPDLRYSFIIASIIIISFAIRSKHFKDTTILDISPFKWLFVFFILMGIVTPIAVWPEMHTRYLIDDLKTLIIVVVAYKVIDTPTKFARLLGSYLVGIFYISFIAWETGRTGAGRLEGIGMIDAPNANVLAAVLVTGIPIYIFYLLKSSNHLIRFLSLVGLTFTLNAIILINSRGSFLALAFSLTYMFIFYFFNFKENFYFKIKLVAGFLFAFSLFIYLADDLFWERMATISEVQVDEAVEGEGHGSRIYFWMKTFTILEDHPFGVGGRGYTYLSPNFLPPEMLSHGMRAVHSTYFQVLAEFGYLGFILFLGFLISLFRLSWKSRRFVQVARDNFLFYKSIALESGYVAFLVASLFLDRLHSVIIYWYILFIICFYNIYCLKNVVDNSISNSNNLSIKD
jgi:putative inorganic carbon (hco3(-)) transporter